MDITGMCAVCGKPFRSLNTCWRCGSLVCGSHVLPEGCAKCRGLRTGGVKG
ncbi:orotate phosphoribosyltransferase [Candidatus Micrarchaeota archaeon]|nr:orotate phosphoribosyltransferase [Candidatus Micrarchaeota archaeon]